MIAKKTGEFYIIEIKAERERGDKTVEAKAKAVERLRNLQPDKFKYQVVYTSTTVTPQNIKPVTGWINVQKN